MSYIFKVVSFLQVSKPKLIFMFLLPYSCHIAETLQLNCYLPTPLKVIQYFATDAFSFQRQAVTILLFHLLLAALWRILQAVMS